MFLISCLAAGLSICIVVWLCAQPVMSQKERAADYSGKWMLKLIWPWVMVLAPLCVPFIPWSTRRSLETHIRIAGLDSLWRPQHIFAMQCLALIFTLAAAMVLYLYADLDVLQTLCYILAASAPLMWWPRGWLRGLAVCRQRQMLKEFPFLLDLTTLCVEAGQSLQGALQQAALHGPDGPLRAELRHALADMRAGVSRMQALNDLANRTDLAALRSLVVALGQADQLGMSLGPLLRAQAAQRRAERFLRAEKLALEAPVKMLFPMVFCIFPCTFLVIGFPIAIKLTGVDF